MNTMYTSGGDRTGSALGNSTYSSSTNRREVLWNVVEPGDPYDIRKSMIAQLPGGQNEFMGQHLEVVCLLQSAEIERLCEFLEDYRYRYREIERRELDRHSYEIQIKQLTQRLHDESGFKSENQKLKDFIKKLSQQNDELKGSKYSLDSSIKTNYESALLNIDSLNREITLIKAENNSLLLQSNSYLAKIQAIESAKERELRELFNKYASDNKHTIEMETSTIRNRYESEVSRLEFEIKRLKEFNEAKNDEINELSGKNKNLLNDMSEMERRFSQTSSTNAQTEQRFTLFGKEIERLNLVLKETTSYLDQASRNELIWQEKYQRIELELKSVEESKRGLEEQIYQLNGELDKSRLEVNQSISLKKDEENKRLKVEIRRLEEQRTIESHKFSSLQQKMSDLEYQVTKTSILERENMEIRAGMSNYQELKLRVSEYENKIAMLSQEIERLSQVIATHDRKTSNYEVVNNEFEEFKRKSLDKERSLTHQYEQEIQRRIFEYESKLKTYNEQSGAEFEHRLKSVNQEMKKLNFYLQEKTEEAESHKRRIRELENSIHSKYEVEMSRKFTSYDTTIKELKAYNEELMRKYKDVESSNSRIAEYENRIAIMTQQIGRLNASLKSKGDELENGRRQLRQMEGKLQSNSSMLEMETTRKFATYEETQIRLARENEDLKRKLQEIVELKRLLQENERRLSTSNQEIQRLSQALKLKVEALNSSETNMRNLGMEVENLRRAKLELENNLSYKIETVSGEASRKITGYEQNLMSLQKDNEELRRKLSEFSNEQTRKHAEYENRVAIMKEEIERLNSNLRNSTLETDRVGRSMAVEFEKMAVEYEKMAGENQQLKSAIAKYEEYCSKMKLENEQLRATLQEKQMAFKSVINEYESFRKKVQEFEGQSMGQNEELKRKLKEYEIRISTLSQENEKISRGSQQELESAKKMIMELKNQISSKHENSSKFQIEVSRKISTYEQNLNGIVRERDELKRVLMELENKGNSMNRELDELRRKNMELEGQYRQSAHEHELWRNKYKELEHNVTQKYEVQITRKISNYQQNTQNQAREIEQYRVKIAEFDLMRKNYDHEIQSANKELISTRRQVESLKARILEYENMRKGYEQNHAKSVQEAERLVQRIHELETTISQKYEVEASHKFLLYEQNMGTAKNQIDELKRALSKYERLAKDHEELKREFERVAGLLQRRNEDYSQLQAKYSQLQAKYRQDTEALKRQLKETEVNITNSLHQTAAGYEQVNRENEELKRRMKEMVQELERQNILIREKVEEGKQAEMRQRNLQQQIQSLHRKMQEFEINFSKRFETEFSRTTSMHEQKTLTITREYETYKNDTNRRAAEYENKIALLNQELDRLNSNLKAKKEESAKMENQLRNLMMELEKLNRGVAEQEKSNAMRFQTEITRTVTSYESKCASVTKQYEEYRRVSERKTAEFENKYLQLQAEIERLNGALRGKMEENGQLDRNFKQMGQEMELIKRKVMETEHSWAQRYESEVTRTTMSYEQNITGLRNNVAEYERKLNELSRKNAEDENKIGLMSQEIERLNQVLRGKVDENKKYAVEIERLGLALRQKNEEQHGIQQKLGGQEGELRQLQNSYSLLTKEYENSKKHLVDYEKSIKKLYLEFERLQIIINELKTERQTLFEKNNGLMQEIDRLTNLANDQEQQLAELRLRLTDQVALQKRINEHMALMVVLFAEIETLRLRLKDKEKEVKEVRRSSLAPFRA